MQPLPPTPEASPVVRARRGESRLVIRLAAAALLVALGWASWSAIVRGQTNPQPDALGTRLAMAAENSVTYERCGECHKSEVAVWERTPHATGFSDLHTRDSAKEIYRKLGLRVIRRATEESTPACLQCHYTPSLRQGELRAGAGVSCESCHGPAREWIGVHNDYGVQEADFQKAALLERPEHRQQRIEQSRAAGMRRPSDVYEVAANCFGCHTVPSEDLVNRGGHSTGSDIEFVEWSQGDIRHNFLESFKTGDGTANATRQPARLRVMYVVGRALDLEYSLRGVALATVDDLYFGAMSDRANNAAANLLEIVDLAPIPELRSILEIFDTVELKTNNRTALEAAAARVGEMTRRFIGGADPAQLTALDPLWDSNAPPAPERPTPVVVPAAAPRPEPAAPPTPVAAIVPTPTPAPAPTATPAPTPTQRPAATGARGGAPAAGPAAAAATPVASTPTPAGRGGGTASTYPTRQRPEWRPAPAHEYVQKVPCGRCHSAQEKWWRRDPHSKTLAPLSQGDSRYAAIADAYGTRANRMLDAEQICTVCHGTAVKPTGRVRAGVGCQQCHGPGADYDGPHEEGPYSRSVELGLTDLKNASTRASTCASCHYITDPGLLAAGHGTGADFNLAEGVAAIKHWGSEFGGMATDLSASALSAAHASVIAERGAPPTVTRSPSAPAPAPVVSTSPPQQQPLPRPASQPTSTQPTPTPGATSPVAGGGATPGGGPAPAPPTAPPTATPSSRGSPPAQPQAPTTTVMQTPEPPTQEARPQPPRAPGNIVVGDVNPVPPEDADVGAAQSIEETLLALKRRLEALYQRPGR